MAFTKVSVYEHRLSATGHFRIAVTRYEAC